MQFLFRPVLVYPIAFFRMAFGLLMLIEGIGAVVTGWVHHYYVEPQFHFPYIGLEWIKPLPGNGMVYVFLAQSVVAFFIMTGWYYRLATVLFFLLFSFSFWSEKIHYLNHHYLEWLLSGVLIFLPTNRWCAVDARRNPESKTLYIPNWPLLLLRVQIVLVYFYAGLAKIQPDWLEGRPLRIWFQAKANYPIIGQYLATEPVIMFTAWAGMIFDLLVAWALLYKPTRMAAFVAACGFHVFNSVVFQVGTFPWFMIAASLLFFEPAQIGKWFFRRKADLAATAINTGIAAQKSSRKLTAALVLAYLGFQVLFPLRHWAIPGDVNWTEEGHRYSWRMMLRSKSGTVSYSVRDTDTGKLYREDPMRLLTWEQASDLADHPDMIWQYAQFLKKHYHENGIANVQVFAHSAVSLNGYPHQPLVHDTVNLAAIKYTWGKKNWVTPRPH